jgi:hypothetical protein
MSVKGSATNAFSGQLTVNGTVSKTGGQVSISAESELAGANGIDNNCALTITPSLGEIAPGKIWASVECNAFRDPTDIGDTGCKLSGQFLFENCAR